MIFSYTAIINGGIGPDIWDHEVEVSGVNLTISQALAQIEKDLPFDAQVIRIEQDN